MAVTDKIDFTVDRSKTLQGVFLVEHEDYHLSELEIIPQSKGPPVYRIRMHSFWTTIKPDKWTAYIPGVGYTIAPLNEALGEILLKRGSCKVFVSERGIATLGRIGADGPASNVFKFELEEADDDAIQAYTKSLDLAREESVRSGKDVDSPPGPAVLLNLLTQ